MDEFQWPCKRRYAHGDHPIPEHELQVGVTYKQHKTPGLFICPGVRAHPDVMIGRQV